MQTRDTSLLPVYAVVALLGATGGFLYLQTPLRSPRPTEPVGRLPVTLELREIPARLWQDPFLALHEHLRREDRVGEGPVHIEVQRFRKDFPRPDADKPVLVLPVAVAGSFSIDDHESRLRSRYALLSALDYAGYEPEEREKISVVGFPTWPLDKRTTSWESSEKKLAELMVPFEWFKTDPPPTTGAAERARPAGGEKRVGYDRVLVLWLDEARALGKMPLKRLQELLDSLVGRTVGSAVQVRYLGPRDSDGLKRISDALGNGGWENPWELKAYSSWATADSKLLGIDESKKAIDRTIASDTDLTGALIEELRHRGVSPVEEEDQRIVLISEWDTYYGRALPLTFAAYVRALRAQSSDATSEKDFDEWLQESFVELKKGQEGAWPTNIHRVIYLKGLDGELPGVEPPAQPAEASEDEGVQSLERPEGRSQLDYVRRLALDLKEREGRAVKAIGVLGSDVYDKLLLLQALRPLFPQAVFFTTDLDARLLHPSQNRWARNLVVATSYGLRLEARHAGDEGCPFCASQTKLPPFRDGYQTALYYAALLALEVAPRHPDFSSPKVYEVGRTKAVEVRSTPSRPPWLQWRLLLVVASGLLLWALFRRFRHGADGLRARRDREGPSALILTLVFVVILVASGAVWFWTVETREPFALAEGISIWPTELIRILAAFVAANYLWRGSRMLRNSAEELQTELRLQASAPGSPSPPEQEPAGGRVERLCVKLKRIFANRWPRGGESGSVSSLWSLYRACGGAGPRWIRVAALSLVYGLLAVSIFATLGFPAVPYSGTPSLWVDRVALGVSVAAFVLLTFFAVDAAVLAERLVRRLGEGPTDTERSRGYLDAEWRRNEVIARRTESVGRLVLGPFIVLFLMIISRLSFFDRWEWPLSLILVIGLGAAWAITSAFLLRRSAELTRTEALKRLATFRLRRLEKYKTNEKDVAKADVEFVNQLMADIRGEKRGAFAPFAEQPAVRAFLIPSVGAGAAAILEFLATTPY